MLINPSKCVSSAQNPERACYSGPSNQERGSKKGSVNRSNRRNAIARFLCIVRMPAALLAASFFLLSSILTAQTISTGSVIGNVTDPQGKPLTGAGIEIANKTNALSVHRKTTVDGLYSSGPIQPGDYTLSISATGFNPVSLPLTVFVGAVIRADVRMQVATEKIKAPEIATVNLDQGAVQGVLFGDWIEKLPSNGRNIFDLGQLEPDVQTQDAGVLDPSKNGIAAISIGSRFGRGTRVSLDGVDISDEVVGATTQNIPASAIQEFQISRSLLDLSSGPAASGTVNIITRSGGNALHGILFGAYRGDQGAALMPGATSVAHSYFQREQFGGGAGGAIIPDRIFWFADAERSKQDLTAPEPFVYPFNGLGATLSEPYRDFNTNERVDWNMRNGIRAFYRLNFFQNNDFRPFGSFSSTQRLRNVNDTLTNALGADFQRGDYTHSVRLEYLKFRSSVNDATSALSGVDNPIPGLGINIGAGTAGNCDLSSGGSYCGGPGLRGLQQLEQSTFEAKYDGSRILGRHVLRFGATYDRIDAALSQALAAFPHAGTTWLGNSISPDPTAYAADFVTLGNGIGSTTSKSAFGLNAGGLGPDNRIQAYVGDRWLATPKLALTYGVQYLHDSKITSQGALPILNQWGAGYGDAVRNPNLNVAPQFGFAWDAGGTGKTVLRGGAGLFYQTSLWNTLALDNSARSASGLYAYAPQVCSGSIANPFVWPTTPGALGASVAGGAGTVVANPTTGILEVSPNFCGGAIGAVAPQILALNSAFQAAAAGAGSKPANPNFVGTTLTALNPNYDLIYPNYRTPRAYQMNLGIEKELSPGSMLSIDYVRNIGEHFLIAQDINHSGAARSFNQANAVAARDRAQLANGCAAGLDQATCMVTRLGQAGAQAAYSAAGLDSNLQVTGGAPCSYCAFPGINPIGGNLGSVGGVDMLFPSGRSVYSGLQVKLTQRLTKLGYGIKSANFQVSYTLSRLISPVLDDGAVNVATDNDNPMHLTGPNALNRKHQISFGGTVDLPFRLKFSAVGHFYSPIPQSLLLPEVTNGGEIFASDYLGAGLPAGGSPEPVPGTKVGQFETRSNSNTLDNVITNYNHTYAYQFTPAGQCLVSSVLGSPSNAFSCPGQISGPAVMTAPDMIALGWVMPQLANAAAQNVGIPWLKSMDLRASWPIKIKDRITLEPSASVLNVFNFRNAYLPGNLPGASLVPGPNGSTGLLAPNAVGGVTPGSNLTPFRATFQSGTYSLGTPRQFEFGLHINF